MNFLLKPYRILFLITLILGILISLTSRNWISIWLGLELNIYSLIPIILQSYTNKEKEAAIKYFIIQALASIILLTATLGPQNLGSPMLLLTSLLIKLGIAPYHFWLPTVINSLSWNMCLILSTIQKIAPIILITHIFYTNASLSSVIAIMRAIVGGIGGLNQTQLRAILAYSSIGHIGWITAASIPSPNTTIIYLFSYILIITATIHPLNHTSLFISSFNPINQNKLIKSSLIINLLRIGGLPPIFGFFPKILVIRVITSIHYTFIPIILILSSTINLYYYLKIISASFFFHKKFISLPLRTQKNIPLILLTIFRTFSSLAIITILI